MGLSLFDDLLHPVLVKANGVESDLLRLNVDEIFLNLAAFVIAFEILFLRMVGIGPFLHLIAEVAFDDRIVGHAQCLVMEFHIILDALESHEGRGT